MIRRLLPLLLFLMTAAASAQVYPDARWIKSGHRGDVYSLQPTPDGRVLVSGGIDGLKIWDIERRCLIRKIDTKAGIFGLALSPDGAWVAIASEANSVDIYEIATGRPVKRLEGSSTEQVAISYSRDGRYIAAASADNAVRVWDVASGSLYATFAGHTDRLEEVSFSPTGDTLVSCGWDGQVIFWDVPKKRRGYTYMYPGRDGVRSVSFAPDGTEVAFGCMDGTVGRIDLVHHYGPWLITPQDRSPPYNIAYSADGRYFACGQGAGIHVYLRQGVGIDLGILTGIFSAATRIVFSADSRYLYAGYSGGEIGIWSAATWKFEDLVTDYTVGVYDVAFSADSRLVAGCSYRYAFVYESDSGVRRNILWGPSGFPDFYSLSFSPDGHNLAGSTLDGNVYIWNLGRDTMETILARDTIQLRWLSYSPDGRRIAVVANDSIIFWNVAQRSVDTIWTGPEFPTSSLAYSTDGKYLATDGTGNMVRIWNAATGALEHSFGPEQTPPVRTKFSPDGSLIASGFLDGEAVVWRVADGQVLRRFHHRDMVTGIGFLPDGKHLVTGSLDSAVIVWDLETGEDVYSYTSYPSNVLRLAVSPDGRYIASGTYDALVLYRAPDGTSGVADRAAAPFNASAITSRPNPARDITTVEFSIAGPEGSVIPSTVSLLDMFGREVLTVLDRPLESGSHSAVINCSALPAGIYFMRLATPSGTSVRELRVVR